MFSAVKSVKSLSLVALFAAVVLIPQALLANGGGHNYDITLSNVELSTGTNMVYAERGTGNRVVIFLHGYLDSWYVWSETLRYMPSKYHCYALSQRGHGDSTKLDNGYEMSDFSEDLLAFMDHFNIQTADIVGHSMGTVIAQRFAIDHPDRARKLVLFGAGANIVDNELLNSIVPLVNELEDPIDMSLVQEFVESVFCISNPYPFAFGLISETGKAPVNVWRKALFGLLHADTRPELPLIQSPTLVVWGPNDPFFLAQDQQDLLNGIPDVRLSVWEGRCHSYEWEEPERAAREVAKFIK